MTGAARSGRVFLSLGPGDMEIIERAAALTGSSTTDFARTAALDAAEEAIRAHEVIRLTSEGSRVFIEALIAPARPNERLRALKREFGSVVGL